MARVGEVHHVIYVLVSREGCHIVGVYGRVRYIGYVNGRPWVRGFVIRGYLLQGRVVVTWLNRYGNGA